MKATIDDFQRQSVVVRDHIAKSKNGLPKDEAHERLRIALMKIQDQIDALVSIQTDLPPGLTLEEHYAAFLAEE